MAGAGAGKPDSTIVHFLVALFYGKIIFLWVFSLCGSCYLIEAFKLCRSLLPQPSNEEEIMGLSKTGWKNKVGTADRACKCGSWKQHWLSFSRESWPTSCSVEGCSNVPTLGAHVINPDVTGERIVPMCDSCNKLVHSFSLKGKVNCPSANKSETCEKTA